MKRTRITSIASCLIVISQLFSFNFSANNFENISTDMTAEEPVLTTETAEKITDTTEKKVSAYVTENELWTAYETFNEFTRKNDLKVIFDFESFKEEYYSLGYNGIEEYLNALYNVFDLRQESDSAQQAETHTADSIDTSDSYRDGLAYSDEIRNAVLMIHGEKLIFIPQVVAVIWNIIMILARIQLLALITVNIIYFSLRKKEILYWIMREAAVSLAMPELSRDRFTVLRIAATT